MEYKILQVGAIGTNCYIVFDKDQNACAIIDPGGHPHRIVNAVSSLGCEPVAILLTHGRYDHTDAVSALQAKWPGIPTYMNHRDAYSDNAYMLQLFPAIADRKDYDEGDVIEVGSLKLEIMATPGHSEGSVTIRCEDTLFCGDTLFAGSMGRTDFPGGSMKKIMESLKRLASLEGNLTVCPGHMEPSNLDRERRTNPFVLQALRNN